MFISALIIIIVLSFVLALRSLKTVDEKPEVSEVKKSLDKDRVIYHSQSSLE